MKQVFYNKEKALKEKEQAEVASSENDQRVKYFERLMADKKFHKYVVEGILNEEIELSRNITGELDSLITAKPEEVQRLMIAKKAGLLMAEKIKNRILCM